MFGPDLCCSRLRVHLPRHWNFHLNYQPSSIDSLNPDGHYSFFSLFTKTGICLKSISSTKPIKGLFSTFAAILSQEVSRGLARKAA